jgi:molybdate transport system permease protein
MTTISNNPENRPLAVPAPGGVETAPPARHSPRFRGGSRFFEYGAIAMLASYAGFIALLLLSNLLYLGSFMAETGTSPFAEILRSPDVRHAAWLTLWTSSFSAALAVLFAVPSAYVLSRMDFRGKSILDMLVDTPIILPNLVVGVTLLVFFRTALGREIQDLGLQFVYAPAGIVLAQFVCVSPYAIRTIKSAFDSVDPRVEHVSRTLGWSTGQVFFRVTLPMIRRGIVGGAVVAWALAAGLYGPMMVFAGTTRQKTEVLATSIYLELSVGRIGTALAIAMILVGVAMFALLVFKKMAGGRSVW